jgi:hypothetical protein
VNGTTEEDPLAALTESEQRELLEAARTIKKGGQLNTYLGELPDAGRQRPRASGWTPSRRGCTHRPADPRWPPRHPRTAPRRAELLTLADRGDR